MKNTESFLEENGLVWKSMSGFTYMEQIVDISVDYAVKENIKEEMFLSVSTFSLLGSYGGLRIKKPNIFYEKTNAKNYIPLWLLAIIRIKHISIEEGIGFTLNLIDLDRGEIIDGLNKKDLFFKSVQAKYELKKTFKKKMYYLDVEEFVLPLITKKIKEFEKDQLTQELFAEFESCYKKEISQKLELRKHKTQKGS